MKPKPTEEGGAAQDRACGRVRAWFWYSFAPSHLADTTETGQKQLSARRRFRAWFPLATVLSYLADAVILALFAAVGTVAAWVPVAYFAVGCMSGGVFYALTVSGYSERYADKFMAMPQICVASATVFVFLACAPSVGIVFLGTLFIVGAFCSMRFPWRQNCIMWAMAVFASSAFLYTQQDVTLALYSSPAQKIIVWIWFALTLPKLMALGQLGRHWRVTSFEHQKKLELALAHLAESITEKEAAEQASRQLAAIVEGSGDAIISQTLDGVITSCNKAAEILYGYTAAEAIGQKSTSLHLPPGHLDEISDLRDRVGRGESIFHHEATYRGKDGHDIGVSLSISPIKDKAGTIIGISTIARDVSERERVRKERERLIAELQEALAKVKVLKGLLPICAWCKKIRDDKGYWQQIEAYISDRSEADFSHAICPECANKVRAETQ